MENEKEKLTQQDKFYIVMATVEMSEKNFQKYCKKYKLDPEEVRKWQENCLQANAGEEETSKEGEEGEEEQYESRFKKRNWHVKRLVLMLIAIVLLVEVGGATLAYHTLTKNAIGVVDADQVDPNAEEVQIAKADEIDEDVINILVVGSDAREDDEDASRSDSIMLLSYNQKKNKATLVSFLRDTLVRIDGHGETKLGHSFAYGGAGLTVNTINEVFDLDIQDYVVVNFTSLVNIIDELDGVEVNITKEEVEYYNENGMPGLHEGQNTLSGSQALMHARNRYLDNDFGRVRRQQDIVYAVYNKVKAIRDPKELKSLIQFGMTQVETNLSLQKLYSLSKILLQTRSLYIHAQSIPMEGSYEFN